jgi:tRNA threonylcarbamoyladenosine biosynthesis protein TsaB
LGLTNLNENGKLLLIDTCGETAGVAVCAGRAVAGSEDLSRGGASAEIVAAVRRLLSQVGWRLADLNAVGVVSGPGSFTGMRTGLATAKGLCEAAGLRLLGVSRLAVLADAAQVTEGLVALDAGRGEVYVREAISGREWLCRDAEVSRDGALVVAEERVAARLAASGPVVCPLHVEDALSVVLRKLAQAVEDAASLEANYVRGEADIYRKPGDLAKAGLDA